MMKPNDLILRSTTSLITFILLGFAIYLLFAGHNSPGGGFVGGLTTSAAFLLMYISFGQSAVDKILSINFMTLVPTGLMIALLTGLGSLLFNKPFLTHTFGHVTLPLLGEFELATAMIFDLGVFLTVLGTTMTIILTISSDQK
ncbi:MAG TPA: Na(+)/H(+) antiporter subunit B [Pseudogracilibacillus sp.]|nr:Na(+)/H(+) antiporter subunit B [Pseudogracilibacillus sp.]